MLAGKHRCWVGSPKQMLTGFFQRVTMANGLLTSNLFEDIRVAPTKSGTRLMISLGKWSTFTLAFHIYIKVYSGVIQMVIPVTEASGLNPWSRKKSHNVIAASRSDVSTNGHGGIMGVPKMLAFCQGKIRRWMINDDHFGSPYDESFISSCPSNVFKCPHLSKFGSPDVIDVMLRISWFFSSAWAMGIQWDNVEAQTAETSNPTLGWKKAPFETLKMPPILSHEVYYS